MKYLICLLVACLSLTRSHAVESMVPHVTVFGTAVREAKPDLLRWRLEVTNHGGDVAEVGEAHAKQAAAVLQLLREEGVKPADLQTSDMQLAEHREYRDNRWVTDGYQAATTVTFTLKDLTKYKGLWLGLSRLPGTAVHAVEWDVSSRIELQNATRLEALGAARKKAEQMAGALGTRIIEPLAIDEIPYEPWGGSMMNNLQTGRGQSDDSDDGAISPGSATIRIRVQVSFRIAAG